jgi:hypothetical protein
LLGVARKRKEAIEHSSFGLQLDRSPEQKLFDGLRQKPTVRGEAKMGGNTPSLTVVSAPYRQLTNDKNHASC